MLKELIKLFSIVFSIVTVLFGAALFAHYYTGIMTDRWLYVLMFMLLTGVSMMFTYAKVLCGRAEVQIVFEQQFRKMLENIKLLAVGMDTEGRVTFCNNALLDLSGWEQEEVIGRNWFKQFIPAENRTQNRKTLDCILSPDCVSLRHEAEIRLRNGERRLIAWNTTEILSPLGQVIGVACIGRDITDERRNEEQLRKLSQAVEQSPGTVMITDADGLIEYVNPKFTQLTGYTIDEVRGKKPSILKSGETADSVYKQLWETITSGGEWHGVFHNKKKNGEYYWEATSIAPICNAEGKITHYVAVKEDLTERKRLEQEVAERKREIAKNQALAVTGRMASMIAHDLRNPLSSIKMGLQILGSKNSETWAEEEYELKQIALGQIAYMEEMMEDLLSYSRPDALKPEWLKLDDLLDTVLIQVQQEITDRHAEVDARYQHGLPNLYGDERKLRQAFTNIVLNALQATEGLTDRKPQIIISLSQELGLAIPAVRIQIIDNGNGINIEHKDKVLEPFFTTRATGTGLGLPIVSRIIEQHHGSLELQPAATVGTHISIILPTDPMHYTLSDNNSNDMHVEQEFDSVI